MLLRLYRRLRWGPTPRFRVLTMPDNTYGKVVGEVEPLDGALVKAPLSSRDCVFYSIVVDVYDLQGHRKALFAEHAGTPFVLRDGLHPAVVDTSHVRVSLRFDHTTESRGYVDAHPHHRALLERHAIDSRKLGTSLLRYSEAILRPGTRVSVIGSGVQELDPNATRARIYRERGPTRLRLMGSQSAPLLVSDHARSL